jgi:hypothetical protein
MMISSPNMVGPRTSIDASRTTSSTERPSPASPRRRTLFSIMITELSTTSPKSMAPRLSKLPAIPKRSMPLKAKSIESGIAAATISPARRLPRNTNRTATTNSAPSSKFVCTVAMTWSTSSVRS